MVKENKDPQVGKGKESKEKEPEKTSEKAPEAAEAQSAKSKWVKVSDAELAKLQEDGKLVGYKPETKEALIK